MDITAIFEEDERGTVRMVGYVTVDYSSNNDTEQSKEVTEDELSSAFRNSDSDVLSGTGEPIEAAVEDPLRFRDFLVLDDGEIAFDEEYVREAEEE